MARPQRRRATERQVSGPASIVAQAEESAVVVPLLYDYEQVEEAHREQVIEAALDIKRRAKRVTLDMLMIGSHLTAIKGVLPHGQFLDWIQLEFDMKPRLAQMWMVAANRLEGKYAKFAHLGQSVIYELTAKSVPDEALIEVEKRIDGEEPIALSEAKNIASRYKEQAASVSGGQVNHEQSPTQPIAQKGLDQELQSQEPQMEVSGSVGPSPEALRIEPPLAPAQPQVNHPLPCPFCSSPNVALEKLTHTEAVYVACRSCGAQGPLEMSGIKTKQEAEQLAIERWNQPLYAERLRSVESSLFETTVKN